MRQTVNWRIRELGDFFKKMETAACVKQESGKLLQKSRTANQPGFVNFNDKFMLNDSLDFYDSHHMNINGVRKFNDLLIKKIETLNVF